MVKIKDIMNEMTSTMKDHSDITYNGMGLIKYNLNLLTETNKNKLLKKHGDAGYIILSAFRGEYELNQNYKRNDSLKKDIKSSGFSYTPVWGGYKETDKETGETKEVKEQSFIVFNFKQGENESQENTEELKNLGKKLAKKYDQESFLYKPSKEEDGDKAYYITPTGKVEMTFNNIRPTDAIDIYFTNLKKSRFKQAKDSKQSVTFESVIYFRDTPNSLAEAYKRGGEIFFDFYNEI